MLDLLIALYTQFVIMLTELKKVLGVWIELNANNLKEGLFVHLASLPQSHRNELYHKL